MKRMLSFLTCACLCLTAFAEDGEAGLATHSKLVLLDLVDAYNAYAIPKSEGLAVAQFFGGAATSIGGGVLIVVASPPTSLSARRARVVKSLGGGVSVIGSALVVGAIISAARNSRAVKNAEDNEKAFLASGVYKTLVKKIGSERAKEFYQDMKSGVSLHRLIKDYLPREAELGFLAHYRRERVILSKIVPETMMEPKDRREYLDLIASRRAMVRMMLETASEDERTKLTALLSEDEAGLRAMVAKHNKGTIAPTTRPSAGASSH